VTGSAQETAVSDEREADPKYFFARIARYYDTLNHVMSLGQDPAWRRAAARAAALPPRGVVLDLGIGTGDLARAVLRRYPDATVHGIDYEPEMMRIGRTKTGLERASWLQADALDLPFADATFDASVSAFVMRNLRDRRRAMAEQRRVVKPGGRVVCLEMTWPRSRIFGALFGLYFAHVVPVLTGLISGQPAAYGYLPRSVREFLAPEQLAALMRDVGLRDVAYRMMGMGTVALHVGVV
jgi:demethylmenaquinone methyltransferase/2-methoxy-6-polyprenyl-1,4-benzoquinol methylase